MVPRKFNSSLYVSDSVDGVVHFISRAEITLTAAEVAEMDKGDIIVIGSTALDGDQGYGMVATRTNYAPGYIPVGTVGPYLISWFDEYDVDTKKIANGIHTYSFVALLRSNVAEGQNFGFNRACGGGSKEFTVANPPSIIAVQGEYSEIRLVVGETMVIRAYEVDNEGKRNLIPQAMEPFTCANPLVASLGQTNYRFWPTLTAHAAGSTEITCTYNGRISTTLVLVTDSVLPCLHHSKNGEIRSTFDPEQSFIRRSLFNANSDWVEITLGSAGAFKAAGFNTIAGSIGSDIRPMIAANYTLENAKEQVRYFSGFAIDYAKKHGLCVEGIGDDMFRGPESLAAMLHGISWSKDYMAYAMKYVKDSGVYCCIELRDEANIGLAPDPQTIPDMAEVFGLFNSYYDAGKMPAWTWPVLGLTQPGDALLWMGPNNAKYATHYWLGLYQTSAPFFTSIRLAKNSTDLSFWERRKVFPVNWPWSAEISVVGELYYKKVPGSEFHPFLDDEWGMNVPNEVVTAQVGIALCYGALGFRYYALTTTNTADWRAASAIGESVTKYSSPLENPGQWAALSAANNLVAYIESDLIQPLCSAVNLGPDILTGARRGERSAVLMAVNLANSPRLANVDMTPYLTPGKSITQYNAATSGLTIATIMASELSVVFAAGEIKVWVCQRSSAAAASAPAPTAADTLLLED